MNTEPTREEMIAFLINHFRSYTLNSWNLSKSYARNVKLYRLGLTNEQLSKAYDILETEGAYDDINELIRDFNINHDYEFQMGFNGRSGGYIVLYQGGKRDEGYTTRCDTCRKLTWYKEEQPCKMNGCCGMLRKLENPVYSVYFMPGKGMDENEDFEGWTDDDLEARYNLVKEFGQAVDECIAAFKKKIDHCKVVERTVMVPKTVKVLECANVEG